MTQPREQPTLMQYLLTRGDFVMHGSAPMLLDRGRRKVKGLNAELRALDGSNNERRSWVDASLVDVLYATSDIHADLAALMGLMRSSGLVELPLPNSPLDAVLGAAWVPFNTYLVVVGDLVDGRRAADRETDDPDGSCELLVHVLLYNARIHARQRGSDVVVTFGNHDVTSVLDTHAQLLNGFIHLKAWEYWESCITQHATNTRLPAPCTPCDPATCASCATQTAASIRYPRRKAIRDMRCRVLQPFYECSPFLVFNVVSAAPSGPQPEVSFVHGAFHADDEMERLSGGSARAGELLRGVRTATEGVARDVDALRAPVVGAALNSRHYRTRPGECMGGGVDARLVVVGHCPTNSMDGGVRDATCGGHGACVVMRYMDSSTQAPCDTIVALVDTGMSGGMRADAARPPVIHMLKLTRIAFAVNMMRKLRHNAASLVFTSATRPGRFGAVLTTAQIPRHCATDIPPVPARGSPHALLTRSFAISRVLVDTSLAPDASATVHVCTHGVPATRGPNREFRACAACSEELRNWL
jgi:hypothetical protein